MKLEQDDDSATNHPALKHDPEKAGTGFRKEIMLEHEVGAG
jgi:hypothetical protein